MDEMELLRQLHDGTLAPTPEIRLRARRQLLCRATAGQQLARRRPPRRLIAAGVVAVVLAAGLGVTATLGRHGGAPTVRSQAVTLLAQAAAAVAATPVSTVAPGQYVYVRRQATAAVASGGTTYLQPRLYEAWLPPVDVARDGRIRITNGATVRVHGGTKPAPVRGDRLSAPHPGSVGPTSIPAAQVPGNSLANPSYAYLRTLPTNPDQLYALVRRYAKEHGVTPAQQMLETAATLLSWSVAPPALRAALYDVVARIPGIAAVGPTVDAAGRHGTAVAVTAAGHRYELIFDPPTGRLLGTREVIVNDPAHRIPARTVLEDTAVTVSVVDTVGATRPS